MRSLIEKVNNTNKFEGYSSDVLWKEFQFALLQGWNGKENTDPLFPELSNEISHFIKSLKVLVKENFRKLKKTESKKSICYKYSVVFYRRYTFNLYKSVTGYFFMSIIILISVGISVLSERQQIGRAHV